MADKYGEPHAPSRSPAVHVCSNERAGHACSKSPERTPPRWCLSKGTVGTLNRQTSAPRPRGLHPRAACPPRAGCVSALKERETALSRSNSVRRGECSALADVVAPRPTLTHGRQQAHCQHVAALTLQNATTHFPTLNDQRRSTLFFGWRRDKPWRRAPMATQRQG